MSLIRVVISIRKICLPHNLTVHSISRDCKVGSIYEGTSNIQLTTIAKLVAAPYLKK